MHALDFPKSIEALETGGVPIRLHTHELMSGLSVSARTVFVGMPGYLDTRGVWHEVMHATAERIRDQSAPVEWIDYSNPYRSGSYRDEIAQERAQVALATAYDRATDRGVVIVNAHSMGFGHAVQALADTMKSDGGSLRLRRTALVGVAPANVMPKPNAAQMPRASIGALLGPDLIRVAPAAVRRVSVARETARIVSNAMGFAISSGIDGPIEAARQILERDVTPTLREIAPMLGALSIYLGTKDPVSPGLASARRLANLLEGVPEAHIHVANTGHVGHVADDRFVCQVAAGNSALTKLLWRANQ